LHVCAIIETRRFATVLADPAKTGGATAPAISGQVLYPATDFAMTHPSHHKPGTSILLTHSVIKWFRDHYLNSAADAADWRASPARTATLAGLPPAYVLTAGADPLRDEGDEYAPWANCCNRPTSPPPRSATG
jgi:acetyl esterase